ncbi:MAG: NlpC/P60 family protein [Bacteroidota bacterium]|nr:NlpC/P60 family protein [Bacteroidota bacterium]
MLTNKHYTHLLLLALALTLIVSSCSSTKKTSGKSNQRSTTKTSKTTTSTKNEPVKTETKPDKPSKESGNILKTKYAQILDVQPSALKNIELYEFIENWYGVPYKYGGRSKNGVDCSNFATLLYEDIYKKQISGSCVNLFALCKEIKTSELKEGDFLFFKIDQTKISHIGVYLHNNKFVHSTTKRGVMINDLDEAYYKKYFYTAGRLH